MKRRRIVNPETGQTLTTTELMEGFGVYVDRDGKSRFASESEVRMWEFVCTKFGVAWALTRLFDRREFPKNFNDSHLNP